MHKRGKLIFMRTKVGNSWRKNSKILSRKDTFCRMNKNMAWRKIFCWCEGNFGSLIKFEKKTAMGVKSIRISNIASIWRYPPWFHFLLGFEWFSKYEFTKNWNSILFDFILIWRRSRKSPGWWDIHLPLPFGLKIAWSNIEKKIPTFGKSIPTGSEISVTGSSINFRYRQIFGYRHLGTLIYITVFTNRAQELFQIRGPSDHQMSTTQDLKMPGIYTGACNGNSWCCVECGRSMQFKVQLGCQLPPDLTCTMGPEPSSLSISIRI